MSLTDLGYTISEYRVEDLSDLELQPILDLSNTFGAELQPRHVALTIEEARVFFDFPGQIRRRFVVADAEGRLIASLTTQYPDDGSNAQMLRVVMSVSPAHRCRGVGSALLQQAAEVARESGRTTLSGEVFDTVPAGAAFANAIGGKQLMDFRTSVLALENLDLVMLREWVKNGPERAPGYSVRLVRDQYPDDLLEGMTHLYHVLERDMPTPDSWEPREYTPELVREFMGRFLQGGEALTAVAIHDEDDATAGMSQLVRRNTDPTTWLVTTTMVDPAHRGHALGKWVKGAVSLEAVDAWPGGKNQETSNAHTNEAMLGINDAMGFRHEFTMTNVEVQVSDVEDYLRR